MSGRERTNLGLFVRLVLQDSGAFDSVDWDGYECVLRKYSRVLRRFCINCLSFQQQLRNVLTVQLQVSIMYSRSCITKNKLDFTVEVIQLQYFKYSKAIIIHLN